MADPSNGGTKNPAQPPKEMSMEIRLLIAFLLMGVVMFLTPYLFKTQPPTPPKKDATAQNATPGATPNAPAATDAAAPAASSPANPATAAPEAVLTTPAQIGRAHV